MNKKKKQRNSGDGLHLSKPSKNPRLKDSPGSPQSSMLMQSHHSGESEDSSEPTASGEPGGEEPGSQASSCPVENTRAASDLPGSSEELAPLPPSQNSRGRFVPQFAKPQKTVTGKAKAWEEVPKSCTGSQETWPELGALQAGSQPQKESLRFPFHDTRRPEEQTWAAGTCSKERTISSDTGSLENDDFEMQRARVQDSSSQERHLSDGDAKGGEADSRVPQEGGAQGWGAGAQQSGEPQEGEGILYISASDPASDATVPVTAHILCSTGALPSCSSPADASLIDSVIMDVSIDSSVLQHRVPEKAGLPGSLDGQTPGGGLPCSLDGQTPGGGLPCSLDGQTPGGGLPCSLDRQTPGGGLLCSLDGQTPGGGLLCSLDGQTPGGGLLCSLDGQTPGGGLPCSLDGQTPGGGCSGTLLGCTLLAEEARVEEGSPGDILASVPEAAVPGEQEPMVDAEDPGHAEQETSPAVKTKDPSSDPPGGIGTLPLQAQPMNQRGVELSSLSCHRDFEGLSLSPHPSSQLEHSHAASDLPQRTKACPSSPGIPIILAEQQQSAPSSGDQATWPESSAMELDFLPDSQIQDALDAPNVETLPEQGFPAGTVPGLGWPVPSPDAIGGSPKAVAKAQPRPPPETWAQEACRMQDATDTVRGLVMELSSLNRLIMSTHRDLEAFKRRKTKPLPYLTKGLGSLTKGDQGWKDL